MDALIPPMRLAPRDFLNRDTVTVGEVLEAAEEAAGVMAEAGAGELASELRAVTDEVRELAEHPSLEGLEKGLIDLSERFEEESKKRELDERDKLVLQLFFFFLQVYLAVFLFMLGIPVGP